MKPVSVAACAKYRFHAAMVPMCWIPLARTILQGTGRPIKAMLEPGHLADLAYMVRAAGLLAASGVPWVKNSSGVGEKSEPARVENISLLKEAAAGRARVKGSGRIRTRQQAEALLAPGAELPGTSAGPKIVGTRDEDLPRGAGSGQSGSGQY